MSGAAAKIHHQSTIENFHTETCYHWRAPLSVTTGHILTKGQFVSVFSLRQWLTWTLQISSVPKDQ